MVRGTDTLKREFGDNLSLREVVEVDQCPEPGCGECLMTVGAIEEAENKMAQTLVELRARSPRAVRFMLRGVFIDEVPLRFPQLTREDVKGWRSNTGEVPEEVIEWAYTVAPIGWITDCRCGHCLEPKPQLSPSP